MSEEKKVSTTEKKVTRRQIVKWIGALAAAGVVGVGVGYGASESMRPPREELPPPPPTFRPPLSPEIQERVDAITKQLISRHADETLTYASCCINGCWGACLVKVHSKNGVVTAIEPDDTIHPNVAIEDNEVSDDEINSQMLQLRGCPKGYAWRTEIYNPNYIKYPMKQVGEKGPNAKFARVSWDEALTLIADKMKYMKEKYGPYSAAPVRPLSIMTIMCGDHFGLGYRLWGQQSCPGYLFSQHVVWGADGLPSGTSLPLIYKSKMIVLWGWDPFINFHELSYYLVLAKKKGIPMIAIDPQLNWSAEVLADQWIPIRSGTDSTMILAIANVLFKEDLYDHAFVEQWVEPTGFAKWKDYVLGATAGPDGAIDRTPEWAEKICGVPAETIREFARLVAKSKPTFLKIHWSVFRQIGGENASRGPLYLTAMLGNLGVPGGFGAGSVDVGPPFLPSCGCVYMPPINTGTVYPPPFPSPVLCNGNADALAHVLHEKLDKGEISVEDFNAEIGNPHPEIGVPNPKMLVNFASVFYYSGYNPMQNTYDTNERLSVLKNTEFVAIAARMRNEVMVQFADIVLPITYQFFHEFCFHASGAGFGGPLDNYIILNPKVTAPVGEAKSELWIETRLAAKLGVGDQVNPRLQNVTDDQWDQAVEALYKEGYEYWTNRDDVKKLVPNPPTWEQLKRQGIIRVPKTSYWVPAQDFIVDKSRKIPTASGKIEFYSDAVAKGPSANGLIMLGDWEPFNFGKGFLPPMFQYVPTKYSIQGSKAVEYPLMMITPHSYYRHHSGHDLNPMTNDEYRHACWLNPADANSRGIKDNDLVHVFSDAGEIMVPAYVTSRIVPGVVIVRFGAWYQPSGMKTPLSPFGVDIRGNPNILIPDDRDGQPIGIDFAATMVEVEKFKEVA